MKKKYLSPAMLVTTISSSLILLGNSVEGFERSVSDESIDTNQMLGRRRRNVWDEKEEEEEEYY